MLRMMFENEEFSKQHRESDPLQWWKNEKHHTLLHHFAKFALCLQATSAPSERSFKSASFLYDKDRASLDEENIEKMVFIRENYRFVEDFSLAELLDKLIAWESKFQRIGANTQDISSWCKN
jgi:hypothetical protein